MLAFAAAGVLWWGRGSFRVRPERIPVRGSLMGALVLSVATVATCGCQSLPTNLSAGSKTLTVRRSSRLRPVLWL